MCRRIFFTQLIEDKYPDGLTFRWFITQDPKGETIIPALAEAELLQAYYNDNKHLPELNECV